MKYTLRQIEVFLSIAHHQNVSRAAADLSLSQSAASGALKELENQFDMLLFDRIGKRLQLNQNGHMLRSKAEALMAMASELESEFVQHNQAGELVIGATLTIGNYLCIDLIRAYRNTYMPSSSKAAVTLNIANTETIKQELLNFDIDIGMLEGEIQHPDLDIRAWRNDKLVCFCNPSHHFAKSKQVTLEQLCHADWVLREKGSGTRQSVDHAFHGHLHALNIVLELEQTEAIKRAVSQGLGIGCLSEIALQDDFNRGHLLPLNCPDINLQRQFYLAVHREKYRHRALVNWLTLCFNT